MYEKKIKHSRELKILRSLLFFNSNSNISKDDKKNYLLKYITI
jgi:hypothetical protein